MEKIKIISPEAKTKEESEFNPERVDRLLEVRHQNAVVFSQIERILSKRVVLPDKFTSIGETGYVSLFEDVEKKMKELKIGKNNQDIYENLDKAFDSYLNKRMSADKQNKIFLEELRGVDNNEESEQDIDEDLGQLIFNEHTFAINKGRISAKKQEGYFVLIFDNDEDYSRFNNANRINSDPKDIDISYGRYHRSVLPKKYNIQVLAIKNRDSLLRTVLHERQHFLNDVAFRDLKLVERDFNVPKEYPKLLEMKNHKVKFLVSALRNIKNELLAYLRDGSDADRVVNFLNNKELYSNLLAIFDEEEKEDIYCLMENIKKELEEVFLLVPKENRAVLVYQLIDVSLVQMPKMLNRMKRFYAKRLQQRSPIVNINK